MNQPALIQQKKLLFIFPKWPPGTIWGHFRFKFPSLGLLTIAGITPDHYDITFIDENIEQIPFDTDADLIALSVMTPLAYRSYEIGDRFRALGKNVVMGGIHVSCFPDEAAPHADAIVIGEGEHSWLKLLDDFEHHQLQKKYHDATFVDMSSTPIARRDLLIKGHYITKSTIQLTRGCPYNCEYCSVTAFFGRRFRYRPLDAFVEEFNNLNDRFVFIVDDNILSNRKVAMALFERLKGSGKWWGSQVPITAADDAELLKAMRDCGCKSLFIGFESLDQDTLKLMGKDFVDASKHADRIKKIQDHGIGILGSFIVGYDHEKESVFDDLYNFITGMRLEAFLISVLTPFPGTQITARLENEGRILSKDWSRYDMNTVLFRPERWTPDKLQQKYNDLNEALYRIPSILKRTVNFKKNMIIFVPQNFGFREAWMKVKKLKENK